MCPAVMDSKPVSSTSFDKMAEDLRYRATNAVPDTLARGDAPLGEASCVVFAV